MSRQPLNPATGRDRAAGQSPLGLTFRYKAAHAGTFWAGPFLIRGEGFADWFRRFCSISPQHPKTSPKTSIFGGCLILDNTPSIASIIPDDADDAMHAGDAKQGAERKQE